jgi:DNA sulfur modification protein DndE
MKNIRKLIGQYLAIVGLAIFSFDGFSQKSFEKLPFQMPEVQIPVFKADTFDIIKFGAKADGFFQNAKAINEAISACSKSGGGVVLIKAGLWLSGPIVMQSNVNLHLAQGALLQFSPDFNDYPLVMSTYEGQATYRCQSPITGDRLQNIAITGKGVIDGSGDAWRPVKKGKMTSNQWKELLAKGGVLNAEKSTWFPSEKSLKGNTLNTSGYLGAKATKEEYEAIRDYLRPVLLSLNACQKVLLDGPTFQNSPGWCLHPLLCEHLTVRNLTVRNPWYAQNGDGIDIESCSIGSVSNCTFDVGDDAICIKSGRDAEGRKRGKPTEYFWVKDCVVFHGHGGFVIGSEMSGGVRNLVVENCTFLGTDIGLRFKSTRGRGGVVENIFISDVNMVNIPADAIRFDMFYGGTSPVPEGDEKPVVQSLRKFTADESTPVFRNFYVKNVACNEAKQAIFIQGLDEMPIQNINFENIKIKANKGFASIDAENIGLKNCRFEVKEGFPVEIKNTKTIQIQNVSASGQPGKWAVVSGEKSAKIQFSGIENLKISDIDIAKDVKISEVQISK